MTIRRTTLRHPNILSTLSQTFTNIHPNVSFNPTPTLHPTYPTHIPELHLRNALGSVALRSAPQTRCSCCPHDRAPTVHQPCTNRAPTPSVDAVKLLRLHETSTRPSGAPRLLDVAWGSPSKRCRHSPSASPLGMRPGMLEDPLALAATTFLRCVAPRQ